MGPTPFPSVRKRVGGSRCLNVTRDTARLYIAVVRPIRPVRHGTRMSFLWVEGFQPIRRRVLVSTFRLLLVDKNTEIALRYLFPSEPKHSQNRRLWHRPKHTVTSSAMELFAPPYSLLCLPHHRCPFTASSPLFLTIPRKSLLASRFPISNPGT